MSLSGACRALQGAEYQLRLSLFDATHHHFFGRTWRSGRRAARVTALRPARAAFNEVGAGPRGRAGSVPLPLDSTRRPGGRHEGRRCRGGRWSCGSSVQAGRFSMHEGKQLFLLEFSLEPLLWCWFALVGAEPFKAASPERAQALTRCLSVRPALPTVVCPARRQQQQRALVLSGTTGSSPGPIRLSGSAAVVGAGDGGWVPAVPAAGGRARCCLSSGGDRKGQSSLRRHSAALAWEPNCAGAAAIAPASCGVPSWGCPAAPWCG